MRLQQYINERVKYESEGRGKEVSEEYVFSELIDKYKKALIANVHNNKVLSRSIRSNYEYYLIDPKQGIPRRSANTLNYYTLIMDNSKKWSRYPDRSKSLICYMNYYCNDGANYIVLTESNANIGVCSMFDLWWSFDDSLNNHILNDLNDFIYDYFESIGANTSDRSFSVFKRSCKKADEDIKKNGIYDNENLMPSLRNMGYNGEKWFYKNYYGDFYKFLENVLDPRKNGFNLTSTDGEWYPSTEAWTDSTSLMIRLDIFKNFKEKCKELGII